MNNIPRCLRILTEGNTYYDGYTKEQFNILKLVAKYNKKKNFYLNDITPCKMIDVWYNGGKAPIGLVKLKKPNLDHDIIDKIFLLDEYSKTESSSKAHIAQAVINMLVWENWFGSDFYYHKPSVTDIISKWNPETDPVTNDLIDEWNNNTHWIRNHIFEMRAQPYYRIMYVEHVRNEFLENIKDMI